MTTTSLLGEAIDGFAVLADSVVDINNGTARAYLIPNWPSPSFSPFFHLSPRPPEDAELVAVQQLWEQHYPDAPACLLVPAGLFLEPVLPPAWRADPRGPLQVIVEPAIEVMPIMTGYTVEFSPLTDDAAREQFTKLITTGFPDYPADKVLAQLDHAPAHTEILAITPNDESAPVAVSAVSSGTNQYCFQSWGTVSESARGLGLSRLLETAGQAWASTRGTAMVVSATRNPRVTGPHRPTVALTIYRHHTE